MCLSCHYFQIDAPFLVSTSKAIGSLINIDDNCNNDDNDDNDDELM